MLFLPHLISLIISLCNYYAEVVMASSHDNDNIEMKPKSKIMPKFDHLAASALGLLKEHRGKMIKKNLDEVFKDAKVMDRILSRRLKAKKKRGKSDKEESSALAILNRQRQHSDPTKAAKAKADPTKAAKADLSCEGMVTEAELGLAYVEGMNEMSKLFEYYLSLPTLLFVQMSDRCTIDNSTGTPILKALKQDFLNVTEAFTDRPYRHESTNSTADFFSSFNDTFDNGGENGTEWPNAAITFVNDNQSIGVAVSAFVGSYFDASDTYYGYNLKQYPEQAAVLSLEELLDGKDSVTFDHCSIFIDSFWSILGAIGGGIGCGILGVAGGGVVGGVVGAGVGFVSGGPVGALGGAYLGGFVGGTGTGIYAGIKCGEAINS